MKLFRIWTSRLRPRSDGADTRSVPLTASVPLRTARSASFMVSIATRQEAM
jgi:hypothetical protein